MNEINISELMGISASMGKSSLSVRPSDHEHIHEHIT